MANDLTGELFAALQRLLPQHTLSRLIAMLGEAKTPWLKTFLIKQFIAAYKINLEEPLSNDINSYASFNDFFTRQLNPDTRPIGEHIVSPADGFISQLGNIDNGQLIQAKGINYSADQLLGQPANQLGNFTDGEFATIYLSPSDYHRVHAPISGQLLFSRYIPGRLFSVNNATTTHIDHLFTRNERLVTVFDTEVGKVALVMVGAMLVAGISSSWHGRYAAETLIESQHDNPVVHIQKGEEIGQFYFGSTVILLFEERPSLMLNPQQANSQIKMGQTISQPSLQA